jgi:hypothetical protein
MDFSANRDCAMHDMIKRFCGQGRPQKLKPVNDIPSYQNPEPITARIGARTLGNDRSLPDE